MGLEVRGQLVGPEWEVFASRLPVGMSSLAAILLLQFRRMRTPRRAARKVGWQIAAQARQAMQCQVCYWLRLSVGRRRPKVSTPRGKTVSKIGSTRTVLC